MFAVYLFLAVIGAYCDLTALAGLETLGPVLLLFATTIAVVHGLIVFGAAWILKIDLDVAAVASQANIGGGHLRPRHCAKPGARRPRAPGRADRVPRHGPGYLPRVLGRRTRPPLGCSNITIRIIVNANQVFKTE